MQKLASTPGNGRRRMGGCAAALLSLLLAAQPVLASRVLQDETGRRVTVPDHARRIVCLTPNVTDDAFAIGAGAEVVAVSDYVKYPQEATRRPRVGSIIDPSLETILALHPDLVLGVPHANPQALVDKLTKLGIPVFLVDPHGMAGVMRSILSVGQATGREAQAQAEVASLEQRIAAVQARVAGQPKPRVFIAFSFEPIFTAGKGAFITEIIADAGGESVTADLSQEWPVISLEAVVARAPDALLLNRGSKVTIDSLRQKPGWGAMQAVRAGRFYLVDERVGLPSPVAVDALEDLARQFHP